MYSLPYGNKNAMYQNGSRELKTIKLRWLLPGELLWNGNKQKWRSRYAVEKTFSFNFDELLKKPYSFEVERESEGSETSGHITGIYGWPI